MYSSDLNKKDKLYLPRKNIFLGGLFLHTNLCFHTYIISVSAHSRTKLSA